MTELLAVSVTAAEAEPGSIGPGSWGFWVVIGLIVVLVFLYFSLRKQLRRVDFDPEATSDEERIASHHEPPPGRDEKQAPERNDHQRHEHRS